MGVTDPRSAMITCPTCSFENKDSADYCERCGRPLAGVPKTEPDGAPKDDKAEQKAKGRITNVEAPKLGAKTVEEGGSATENGSKDAQSSDDKGANEGNAKEQGPRRTIKVDALSDLSLALGSIGNRPSTDALQEDDNDPPSVNPLQVEMRTEPGDSGKRTSKNTLVEGLPAIKGPDTSTAPTSTTPRITQPLVLPEGGLKPRQNIPEAPKIDPEPPPQTETRLNTAPVPAVSGPGQGLSTRALVGIFFGLMVFVAIGAALVLSMDDEDGQTTSGDYTRPTGSVEIAGGTYLRGLANDYRLMFSQRCKKVAEDPETECKEDFALKGELPQETVEVAAFKLDVAEVTNDDWQKCVDAGACKAIDAKDCKNYTLQSPRPSFRRIPQALFRPDLPVVCVNRQQAQDYCKWAGGQLPTHDQWEKAARGKDAYTLPWGTNWNPKLTNWGERDMAGFSIAGELDGHLETAPVGSYPEGVSPHGIYDMAGNVAEWVQGAEDGPDLTPAARGGSWRSTPLELRMTRRLWLKAEDRRTDVGLRCAYAP